MKWPAVAVIHLVCLAFAGMAGAQNLSKSTTSAAGAGNLPSAWQYSAPLIAPEKREVNPTFAQKDPTVVFHEGKWHVFMTIKCQGLSATEYCSFDKWENADKAPRTIMQVSDAKYYCAPQVFYFAPQKKWYLVYQVGPLNPENKKRKGMWVAYSTTDNIADPNSWTKAQPMPGLDGEEGDVRIKGGMDKGGLDYWIICDDQRAYLFITTDDGNMWRLWTKLEDFPKGFDHCELAIKGDIFEGSHTYKLKGTSKYLTVIEACEKGQGTDRRYYKSYLADSLDGKWEPLAATKEHPFAGWVNIQPGPGVDAWVDNISHGEIIRDGNDQTMTVDPNNIRFVFQGLLDTVKKSTSYSKLPWRVGILSPIEPGAASAGTQPQAR